MCKIKEFFIAQEAKREIKKYWKNERNQFIKECEKTLKGE